MSSKRKWCLTMQFKLHSNKESSVNKAYKSNIFLRICTSDFHFKILHISTSEYWVGLQSRPFFFMSKKTVDAKCALQHILHPPLFQVAYTQIADLIIPRSEFTTKLTISSRYFDCGSVCSIRRTAFVTLRSLR